jgi:hypothetical protein
MMRNVAYTIIFVLLVATGMYYGFNSVANMPDVHISHSTGECVKVINYDERFEYTCENYPEKYNHVWVK